MIFDKNTHHSKKERDKSIGIIILLFYLSSAILNTPFPHTFFKTHP